MLRVEDLSGTATAITNPNPDTVDAYYMDVTVPAFSDHKAATYAKVHVKDYQGFPMALDREFLFVKNRFCLVRDTAQFRESFLARRGPAGSRRTWTADRGPWANTYIGLSGSGPNCQISPHGSVGLSRPARGPAVDGHR